MTSKDPTKVKVTKFNGIHNNAQCENCSWGVSCHHSSSGGISAVYKHVRETGHTVARESGRCVTYSLEDE